MKKILILGVMIVVVVALLQPQLGAQKRQAKPTTVLQKPILKLVKQTDLRMDVIHSSSCGCELKKVNALYLPNIMVDFSNHKIGTMGAATKATIQVQYFDLVHNKQVKVTKTINLIRPYPNNPWTYQKFVMVNHPVLVRKGVGIRATITVASPNIKDTKPANNVLKSKKCQIMVY